MQAQGEESGVSGLQERVGEPGVVSCLPLPLAVQRLLQHQLGVLGAVAARLHVQREVRVGAELVRLQGVGARVGVLRALQREARAGRHGLADLQAHLPAGERGVVVVHVQDLHRDAEQLQRALGHDLQAQHAGRQRAAQLLAVDALGHAQLAGAQVGLEELAAAPRHHAQVARLQLPERQAQVERHVPHGRADGPLLGHRVTDPVDVLAEDGWVVVGIGDVDTDLGSPGFPRLTPIEGSEDQVQSLFTFSIERFLQHQFCIFAAIFSLSHF
uniref:Uncharacterized protein n=1 Tax=Varanus komodoensis TaxID=61221 RepID=A0A8D2LKL3_VARKO